MSLTGAIAANRFGLGARPGEIGKISADPKGWLLAQLAPEGSLPAPLRALPSTLDDQLAFYKWLAEVFKKGKEQGLDLYGKPVGGAQSGMAGTDLHGGGMMGGQANSGGMGAMGAGAEHKGLSIEGEYIKTFGPRLATALKARFDTAVQSERPFFERLVHFWVNHFVVSGIKPGGTAMPPSFERDVIRPNVTGKFSDMLMASTKHPAMLFYLDNMQSIGPDSKVGKQPKLAETRAAKQFGQQAPKKLGLNENLAREIMELQTLGVRSGYTQADVTSFAKMLTGWTLPIPPHVSSLRLLLKGITGQLDAKGLFYFDPDDHEPGAQTILGKVYAQKGVDQGEAVLNDLAHHPATAHFVATKLVRHFIADDPPKAAVERIAKVFRETGGDLGKVSAALVESPEAFAAPLAKFKTPDDYLISMARALPGLNIDVGLLMRGYGSMGQTPYMPPGPNGWPDVEGEWMGSDAVWKRFQMANEAAERAASSQMNPAVLAGELLGPTLSADTLQAVQRAESPAQGLTLLLASSEFQRR